MVRRTDPSNKKPVTVVNSTETLSLMMFPQGSVKNILTPTGNRTKLRARMNWKLTGLWTGSLSPLSPSISWVKNTSLLPAQQTQNLSWPIVVNIQMMCVTMREPAVKITRIQVEWRQSNFASRQRIRCQGGCSWRLFGLGRCRMRFNSCRIRQYRRWLVDELGSLHFLILLAWVSCFSSFSWYWSGYLDWISSSSSGIET